MLRNFRFSENQLILFIVTAGALLRLWHYPDIPLTHDEFSAIFRARFDNFHDLIEKGIRADGHPAGVQVFTWLIVSIFGESAPALKSAFEVFSILSILLIYKVGKKWFNGTSGLIAAGFMAFLQYPVMYGQVARPYSPGLFFSLLMVYCWTHIIFTPGKAKLRYYTGFVLSAALCGYIHHFAMLFAVITGLTGIFLADAKKRVSYLVTCLIPVILYLPHLPITLAQLSIGGVEGWLHKPRPDFLFYYIAYIFHFSLFILLVLMVLAFLAYNWRDSSQKINIRMMIVSLTWFLLPILTGYFYSIYRSSVLQYSVLIFSFPYLLLFLSGFFTTVDKNHQLILVAVTLLIIPSLVFERLHFELFYKNPYREILSESVKTQQGNQNPKPVILLDTKKEINEFYGKNPEFHNLKYSSISQAGTKGNLLNFLNSTGSEQLVFGCDVSSAWENYAVIQSVFPHLMDHQCYAGGDFYRFSREHVKNETSEYYLELLNDFEPNRGEWINFKKEQCTDFQPISGKTSYDIDTTSEYSPTFFYSLRDLYHKPNDVIDISVDVRLPQIFPGAWLIASVTSGNRNIYWASSPVNEYVKPGNTGKVFLSLRLSDIELRHHKLMLTSYIWNPRKTPFTIDNFDIRVRKGNPVIYGLIRPVR